MKVELGNLVKIRTGKLDANAAVENGQYPFFTCSKEKLFIDKYSYDCECVLVAGNGDLDVKYYNGKFDAYQRTYIIESKNKELYMPYLFWFMQQYVETLRKQAIGGVIKYIKLENLTDVKFNLFSYNEQKNLVEKLEKVQNVIEQYETQLKSLDLLVKSRFVEMFGDPVYNTKHLLEKTLPELGEFGRGVSKHRPRNAPELLNGKYPLIQTGDVAKANLYIKDYTSTYSELGLKQSKMWKKGTLCITIAANIAETAILNFDACFPDSVVGFVANDEVSNIYIHFWFSFFQDILEKQAPVSAQKNINLQTLSNLKVIVPAKKEIEEFTNFVIQVDKSKFVVQQALNKTKMLMDSLMQEYFG